MIRMHCTMHGNIDDPTVVHICTSESMADLVMCIDHVRKFSIRAKNDMFMSALYYDMDHEYH